MKNQRSKTARRRRGTIIILVVAVLALLAVIGTIYIISARTERAAATAAATNVNMVLAERAAMNSVAEIIGNSMYDAKGQVGGYAITDGGANAYGTLAARNYDYPDSPPLNFTTPAQSLVDPVTGATMVNGSHTSMRGEPWLAPTLHNNINSSYQTGTGATCGDAYLTSAGFDPYTAKYDLPLPITTSIPPASVNVVNDQTAPGLDPYNKSSNPDGINSTTPPPPDAYWNLLPFSDASGIRYRYAVRILDTSRMANLNIGSVDDATAKGDTTGSYFTSYDLAPAAGVITDGAFFNQLDNTGSNLARNLHISAAGRGGTSGIGYTDLTSWQKQFAFHIEELLSPASGAAPFDLSDELELRSYGEYGTTYHARPAIGGGNAYTLWPNTLSGDSNKTAASSTVIGNPARRNYTTYSFSREIRAYADPSPIYYLTPSVGVSVPSAFTWFPLSGAPTPTVNNVWPPLPARAAANPDIVSGSQSDNDADFYVAMAATNIATAMQNAGFLPDEVCAFVANYVTARTNVPQSHTLKSTAQTPISTPVTAYYLPFGPSYVDSTGICIQSSTNAGGQLTASFGGAQNYTSSSGGGNGNLYLGYSAQPFFNEVVVDRYQKPDANGNPTPFIADSAVELVNPYSVALDLTGYQIQVDSNPVMPLDGLFVPANGFLVVYNGGGDLSGKIAAGSEQKSGLPQFVEVNQGGGKVILRRLYTDRTGGKHYAAVDAINYANLLVPVAQLATADQDWSIERLTGLNPATSPPQLNTWGATMTSQATTPTNSPTLGAANATPGTLGLRLYDRTFDSTLTTTAQVRAAFANVAEFNHLMRVCHVLDGSDNSVNSLEDHLNTILGSASPAAPYSALTGFPNEKYEAQLHFDFLPNAAMFNTSPPSDPGAMDFRAVKFLDQVAFIDRVSDATIDVGGGALDINKIRLPGQINPNTASGDVLRALPAIQLLTIPNPIQNTYSNPNPTPDQVVANILAYRVRASLASPIKYNTATSNKDYSSQTTYPGVGFRSLAELSIPINDAGMAASTVLPMYITLSDRDKTWASIYNLCTVRSDTFVVYGYLEAIKSGTTSGNNNANSWYGMAIDNPFNSGGFAVNLIRLARVRWVAIVDRSFCNYAVGQTDSSGKLLFQMPRIVAIKDLPK